ncbi:MAG: MBL fold metallo-hydrolase [Pseudomonadales bacterium]|nr:MBL fold metallo-hydrolase [Pseudomonadales bacterium]
MKIIRIYMDNSLNNYCHLIICENTNEAIIVDPLDVDKCLAEAERQSCRIVKIINTHEHFDHIDGNPGVVAATGAKIHAHKNAIDSIPDVDVGLSVGDCVEVGSTVRLRVLDTPGHTMAHVCLLSEIGDAALLCGDTLFNASSGNCKFGGNVHVMYKTFVEQLAKLPDNTSIYPGHDYIVNNLRFSLSREPNNEAAKILLAETEDQTPEDRTVTTMATEKQINPFFRLDNTEIINNLQKEFADQANDPESVFVSLGSLRDNW